MNNERRKPFPSSRKSSKQKLIEELDQKNPSKIKDAKVATEIITDHQEIVQGSGEKQAKRGGPGILPDAAIPYQFKPGQSGNPSGRAPDMLKAIGLRIAQLKAEKVLKPKEIETLKALGIDTASITVIEALMAQLAMSKNPVKQQMYMERVFGKVPNINLNAQISESIVTKFKSKFTDAELERIVAGEDALEILLEKLPDVNEDYIDADASDV